MKEMNVFIDYEYMESRIVKGDEFAVYLVKLKNDDKYEFVLHECMTFNEDGIKPFDMKDVFVELISYYTMYCFYQRDYDAFYECNEDTMKPESIDMLWEKAEIIAEKLENLYGANLRYFIQTYLRHDYLIGLLPDMFLMSAPPVKIKQMVINNLMKHLAKRGIQS